MPVGGRLVANSFAAGETFIFNVKDPRHPVLERSLKGIEEYTYPHSFDRTLSGNILATFQTKGEGNLITGGLVAWMQAFVNLEATSRASPSFAKVGRMDCLEEPTRTEPFSRDKLKFFSRSSRLSPPSPLPRNSVPECRPPTGWDLFRGAQRQQLNTIGCCCASIRNHAYGTWVAAPDFVFTSHWLKSGRGDLAIQPTIRREVPGGSCFRID